MRIKRPLGNVLFLSKLSPLLSKSFQLPPVCAHRCNYRISDWSSLTKLLPYSFIILSQLFLIYYFSRYILNEKYFMLK